MSDRNWEAELAKIDKQLASVSDEQLLAQSQPAPTRGPVAAAAPSKSAPAKGTTNSVAPVRSVGSWVAWVQLIVAVAAGVGLWFWPWATRCGLNAITFTAATGGVTLLGLWSAIGSWRHRQAAAHVLSFAVMIWGLVLGAREVLPRMGYAIPTAERPGSWSCEASPVPSPSVIPGAQPAGQIQNQPALQPVSPANGQPATGQPATIQPGANPGATPPAGTAPFDTPPSGTTPGGTTPGGTAPGGTTSGGTTSGGTTPGGTTPSGTAPSAATAPLENPQQNERF